MTSMSEIFESSNDPDEKNDARQFRIHCYREGLILLYGGIPYSFKTVDEMLWFLSAIFKYSQDRAQLYSTIVSETINDIDSWSEVLELETDEESIDTAQTVMECLSRAVALIFKTYGDVYDPNNSNRIIVTKQHM